MRIVIICPHLSTGGLPSVALKRVESLIKNNDVYLIEYREISWSFVIQRNKIKKILGERFITLGNLWLDDESKRDKFQQIIENINPDIIHMEEIPELFYYGGIRKEHTDWLYRDDRPYKLIETTHTSTFDINQKKYFPDKFLFVSNYSKQQYSVFNIPSSIVEYPIEKFEKNKGESIKKLGFDPDYFHILNVGLFSRGKNQGYIFDIAKKLKDYKIHFHFVGNQAENFSDYWIPLMENKLDNCFIHGEIDNVDLYYQASDLLIHSSILELNPLVIKEATSYDLPIFINNLPTYLDSYDSYKNVKYITLNVDNDAKKILDNFNIKRKDDVKTFESELLNEYNITINNKCTIQKEIESHYEYNISFIKGAKVEILGQKKAQFDIDILDKNTNKSIYKTTINNNNWCSTNNECYKEYKINISNNNKLLITHEFDLKNKNVLISLDSKSIGDTIAWFPYVEEFRKKHNCNVYCTTFWNSWFINKYIDIIFLEPGTVDFNNIYAHYKIGWYNPYDSNKNPIDFKKIPLQKTASDILGLKYKEIIPIIDVPEGVRPIKEKYVCIGQFSTANSKHWHYPNKDSNKGWQILVDWLNKQGYKVMVISKQPTNLKNIIDKTGNFPIEHRFNELKHCEFFIGVGSGLSWLAWAIGKKVVMISGFSNPFCEFKTNNINVHNFNVCNGCFNTHEFDRGDWNWCPIHKNTDKQFECTINITPKMVVDKIVENKLVENVIFFDFNKYDVKYNIKKENLTISYDKVNNKLIIVYNDKDTPLLNIDIKKFNSNEIYYTISDTSLSKKHIVWCIPSIILHENTDKLNIVFYEKDKILELEYKIK